ncbi:hypothetical protein METSCH_B05680 [Metschnikowia aff. pulcherrima]|uniref:Uncharacterized protein n=1 Tax=Metschnikowia aff. pulcherrima TaxID=2163413 RepID=A0A4P6XMA2_9ASCO|nr:hypothetical protein METSCH_B05680 [Metschnikowia aff. pulcherrima]
MPAKQSLAERYALRLSQTLATQNHYLDLISQILSDTNSHHNSPRTARSPRKLLAEKYQTQKAGKIIGRRGPGASGLPIKRVSVSRQDVSDIALPKLYKTTQSPELFARKRLFQQADANDYKVSKKQSSGARVAQIARGITNFLGSMRRKTPESATKKGHDGVQGSISKYSEPDKYDDSFNPRKVTEFADFSRNYTPKRVLEDTGDIDEVDIAIRENKHRQEKERLERQLNFEKQQIADLKEEYERKLYVQKRDYEAQLHALKEEIVYLKEFGNDREAARRQTEIRQKEAQHEKESILEDQNRILADLDECKKSLFEKETLLAARGEELARKTENFSPRKEILEGKKPSIPETAMSPEPAIDNERVTANSEEKDNFHSDDFSDTSDEYSSFEPFGVNTKKLDTEVVALYNSLVSTLKLLDHKDYDRGEPEDELVKMAQKLEYWIRNVNGIPDPKYGRSTARIRDVIRCFDRAEPLLATEPRRALKEFNLEKIKKVKGSLENVINRFTKKSNVLRKTKESGLRGCNEMRGLNLTSPPEEITRYFNFLGDQVATLWLIRECARIIEDARHALNLVERVEKAMQKYSEEKEEKEEKA